MTSISDPKVVVVGLDSLDWDFVHGHPESFPNVLHASHMGATGKLLSTYPPVTAPAWVSFATGRNPGGHGCFDFTLPGKDLFNTKAVSAKNIASPTVYEILEKKGIGSVLINLPVSYPPRSRQITVTSLMTRGDNCVFPATLLGEIPELGEYRIVPDFSYRIKGDHESYFRDIRSVERKRFEVAKRLYEMKEWGFFFVLFSGTDLLLHTRRHSPPDFKSKEAWKAFEEMDSYVGWFLDKKLEDRDTTMILMSDHGSCLHEGYFHINEWLYREGYLERGISGESYDTHMIDRQKQLMGVRKEIRVSQELVRILNLSPLRKKVIRAVLALQRRFLNHLGLRLALHSSILPKRTKAYTISPSSRAIYINSTDRFEKGSVQDEDYEALRDEIIRKLSNLRDPFRRIVTNQVFKREEIYSGDHIGKAPDIVFHLENYNVETNMASELFRHHPKSSHSMHGMFSIVGPSYGKEPISGARIIDLSPTILSLLGVSVPPYMDGKVLRSPQVQSQDAILSC